MVRRCQDSLLALVVRPACPIIVGGANRRALSHVMNQMDMDMLGDQRGGSLTARFYEGLG